MPINIGGFKSNFDKGYAGPDTTAAPTETIIKIISNLIAIITVIAGVSFLIYFVLGAVNWITSGGDTQKAANARSTILNAIIGLIITVIAYPAILLISSLLGVPLASPAVLTDQLFIYR